MGFLSLFNKRSSDKAKAKTQTTNDAPPPPKPTVARTITTAVPTNGKTTGTVAKELTPRGRPKVTPTRISPPITPRPPAAAPAPAVRLFRDEESVERPRTAPNGDVPSTGWVSAGSRFRKTSVRGAPPVSFRLVRPSTANPAGQPVSRTRSSESIGGVPQSSHGHSRNNSMSDSTRSDGGKGFKDLLDAHSEIKPLDFKSRVIAAGVRDFGEDVADRNLGENGFNLTSPPVQAFYAHSSKAPHVDSRRSPEQKEVAASVHIAEIRAKSLTSSVSDVFPMPRKAAARESLAPVIRPPGTVFDDTNPPFLKRRQSADTYAPVSALGSESDPSSARSTDIRTTRNPARQAVMTELERPSTDHPRLSFPALNKTTFTERPKTARPATARPTRTTPRDSPVVPKQRAVPPSGSHYVQNETYSDGPSNERSTPPQPSTRPHRGSVVAPASVASVLPRKRHSLHTLQSSASFGQRDFVFDATPLSYPRLRYQQTAQQHEPSISLPDVTIDFDVASSPTRPVDSPRSHYMRTPFTMNEIREVTETEPAPSSASLVSGTRTHLDEGSEHATLRTRSLRGWSTSSATPTTSDTSSNPFQRPQSRHTANTSIDLSHGAPSINKVPSHASLDSGTAMSPKTAKSGTFNIDDYLSSDDDSFVEPRRPRGEGEEGLLFSESGYGADGFQLPGLLDSLPKNSSPRSKQMLQHARSSISLPPSYDYDSFGRANGRRFILDTAADSDDETPHYPENMSPLRYLQHTKRLSAICGSPSKNSAGCAHDVIMEERTGKVDVAAAVKLRKENKAKKRASGISLRPRKARSSIPLGANGGLETPVDDEANHADVE